MCNDRNKDGEVYVDQWQAAESVQSVTKVGKCLNSGKGGKVFEQ